MVDYTGEVPDHILLANAEKYANGANILMCGYGNNVKRVTNNLSSDVGMANMAASMGAEVGLSIARNSYETAKKPNNIGIGTNKKNTDLILKEIDQVSECVDDIFSMLDYVCIGMEVGENAYNNMLAERGTLKILWDSTVDGGILILNAYGSGMAGAAAASAVAPQYALVAGFAVALGTDYILSDLGYEIRRELKKWIK